MVTESDDNDFGIHDSVVKNRNDVQLQDNLDADHNNESYFSFRGIAKMENHEASVDPRGPFPSSDPLENPETFVNTSILTEMASYTNLKIYKKDAL